MTTDFPKFKIRAQRCCAAVQEKSHDRWSQEKSKVSLWLEELQNSKQSGEDAVDSLICHKDWFRSVFTTSASSFCLTEDLYTYPCLSTTGEGRALRGYWHRCLARVWGKWAIIDTTVSPGGGSIDIFGDWERVIVHTREELARGPTERGIEWYLRVFARMRAVRLFFASASSDQFSHANSEHFVNFHHLESLFIETLFCAK